MNCTSQVPGCDQSEIDDWNSVMNRDRDTKVDWETFHNFVTALLESLSKPQLSIWSTNNASSVYCDLGHLEWAERVPYSASLALSRANDKVLAETDEPLSDELSLLPAQ